MPSLDGWAGASLFSLAKLALQVLHLPPQLLLGRVALGCFGTVHFKFAQANPIPCPRLRCALRLPDAARDPPEAACADTCRKWERRIAWSPSHPSDLRSRRARVAHSVRRPRPKQAPSEACPGSW